MNTFLCKFFGSVAPNQVAAPTDPSQWEGHTANVPRPHLTSGRKVGEAAGKGSADIPSFAVGDRVYLWVHDVEPGSNGKGLTARAWISAIEDRGQDDVDIRVGQLEMLKPVRFGELTSLPLGKTAVGSRIHGFGHRQTLFIEPEHLQEWEEAVDAMDDKIADANLEMMRQQVTQESLERFQLREARPGQGAFREAVLRAHGRRCIVTGEAHPVVLDAAHVIPYAQSRTWKEKPRNGIVLRADLHRLFDAGLLSFDEGRVSICGTLAGTQYADFHDRQVRTNAYPGHLREHHEAAQKIRRIGSCQ